MNDRVEPPPKPSESVNKYKLKRYHAIGADGLAEVGTKLENGDIFVNKTCPEITDEARRAVNSGE